MQILKSLGSTNSTFELAEAQLQVNIFVRS